MNPVETGLTLVLAIATSLSGGLKAFKDKKYDEAKTQLTVVIDKADVGGEQWQVAKLYRAKTSLALDKKDDAKKDLLEFLKRRCKPELRKDALAEFLKLDGKKTDFLPKKAPKKLVADFFELSQKKNYDAAIKLCTGPVKKTLEAAKKRNMGGVGNRNVNYEIKASSIGEGKDFGKAWVEVKQTWGMAEPQNFSYHLHYELILFPKEGEWKISSQWYEMHKGGADDAVEKVRKGKGNVGFNRKKNAGDLKQLALELLSYSGDMNGDFPKKLADVKVDERLPDGKVYLWTHPLSGDETMAFIYRPGLRDDDGDATTKMIMAAPDAYDGKRNVLFVDGHVELVDETDFKKNARAQGWVVKFPQREFKGSKKAETKAEALIKDLGADDFKTRRAAKRALKELGEPIVPILQRHLNHDDPEVKEALKNLIENM